VSTNLKAPEHRQQRRGRETFWYMGLYEFDVDQAIALVGDGREPVELDEESARASVEQSALNEAHLPNVDPTVPGIIAHVSYREEGEVLHGHVLIDGHHRAARCLREGRPVLAYLLSEDESEAVLLRGPEDLLPPAKVRPRREDAGPRITHPDTGSVWSLDEEEAFLLEQLDGTRTSTALQSAYEAHFAAPLARQRLNSFLKWAQGRGLLVFATDRELARA
jgi:hypothetical protein